MEFFPDMKTVLSLGSITITWQVPCLRIISVFAP